MRKPRKKEEENLQLAVSRYINLQYSNVLFTSDASGLKLPIGLASKWKSQRCVKWKIPDMIILHPKWSKTTNALLHLGLVLELKKSTDELYRKDGTIRMDAHILEQEKALQHLEGLGYHAQFVCGFDEAKWVIDWYLG